MTIDNALPGLELDCAPDPCCPIDCEACTDLPFGESVRKEQLAMMTTAIRAQEIVERILNGPIPEFGSQDAEMLAMSTSAMGFGFGLASVIGLLLKDAPELAHRAVEIFQDECANGDVYYTEQLYSEAEKLHQAHVVKRAERLAAMAAETPKRPTVVTLCGSTRFKDAFVEANKRLTLAGHIVISVGLFAHADLGGHGEVVLGDGEKAMLDELHKRKIDMADVVYIVSDESGYIGDSTRGEIAYSKAAGKRIEYCPSVRMNLNLKPGDPGYDAFYDADDNTLAAIVTTITPSEVL